MMPLTFAHQTTSVFSLLIPVIITVFLLLIPTIIIEPFLLQTFLKKSWSELCKFCTITNLISSLSGILFAVFARNPMPIFIVLPCWLAFPIVIIWIENVTYRKYWKETHKAKLLGTLIIINLISYIFFSVFTLVIISPPIDDAYMHRLRCTNNLKQIGLGLAMYGSDYKDFLPNNSGIKGFKQLRNYSLNNDVFRCPSTTTPHGDDNQKLTIENVDYIYQGGLKFNDKDAKTPLAWDKPTNHEDYGNVVFLDGHVSGFKGKDWMEQAGIKKTAAQQKK